jgi:NDP-sugar pyrophosphorylase family protein
MKAILMCAGNARRTLPLTENLPKSLLKILNSTIIENTLDILSEIIDEVIIVVGYLKEKIIEKIGNRYKNLKILYKVQDQVCGTGNAVLICENFFEKDENFLVLNGDDIYSKKDLEKLIQKKNSLLCTKVENPSNYGVLQVQEDKLIKIIEKPKENFGNLVNIGCYFLSYDFFEYLKLTPKSQRGEVEITCCIEIFCQKNNFNVILIDQVWLSINYPSSYAKANFFLKKETKDNFLDKNTKIDSLSKLENCIVFENSQIKKSKLKNCIILENSNLSNIDFENKIIGNSIVLDIK